MREYLFFIAVTLALSWIIKKTYIATPFSLATKNKNRLCYFLIFAILSIFVGLRTFYNDTATYLAAYEQSVAFPDFWNTFDAQFGANPGFTITQALLKTFDVSPQGFLLLFAALSVGCSIYFLKTFSSNFTLSLFLFFATNAYTLTAAAVKQSVAIALSLIAVTFAFKKKWILFAVLIFLAATFHPYVLLYALVPVLTFRPWSKMTYIMLATFILLGFMLNSLLGTIVDITSMIGDAYTEEAFIGEGINIFRVLVANVPLILTFIYRNQLFEKSTKANHLLINLAMLNGAIMFVGMFGTAIYFSRMASYFTIAQCVALPWILGKLPQDRKNFYTVSMIVGYCGFFVYANMISQSFDANFSRITLFEYLNNYVFQ